MGNIILLDLITLNYINFPFFFFQGYPYYINNFIVFPHNFSTLIDCQSYYNFFFLDLLIPDHFEYFTLCKFYLYFNQLVIPLGFLFIYLIILTISIFTKIRLYLEFKHLVKKFIFYLRVLNFKNLFIFYPYFYWNLIYLLFFWVRKKTWNRLNFRSLELRKKKNPKYHQWQYIKFFYVKLMLDLFFSIALRLILFLVLFIIRGFFYLIYSFLSFFILKSDIYLIYIYLISTKDLFIKKLSNLTLFKKIFSLVNYLKIEFFLFFFNDRSFLGGFIYYLYNMINYKIGILYNSNNWDNAEFKTSSYLGKYYDKINPFFNNYNINSIFSKVNLNYIYLFVFLPFYFLFFFFNFWVYCAKSLGSLISYYDFIELRYFIYFNWKIILLVLVTFYLFLNLDFTQMIIFLLILFIINYFNNILPWLILFSSRLDIFFYYSGFLAIYFFDLWKNIVYYFFWILIYLFLKLKYLLLLIILYKLGLLYLLNLGFLNLISNYLEWSIFIILDKFLYAFLDYYNLKNYAVFSYTDVFNHQLINIISYDFFKANEAFQSYINNSFLNRIYTLNFKSIDLSRLSWKAFIEYQRSSTRSITARKYYFNLFMEFIRETLTFFSLCKNYFLIKFFKFYYIYLWRHSDYNLYYYFFKKLYTFIYLLFIYLYFYLKWLYCYFVPLYLIPKLFISKLIYIYIWLYLFYYKIFFIFSSILKLLLSFFIINFFKFIYFLTLIKIFILNIIIFIYYIIYDLILLVLDINFLIYYPNNYLEWYLDFLVNKTLFRENFKDLFINYFRIPKKNLINFNLNESLILGSKLRSVSLLDIDNMNMKKVKEAGLMVHQLEDFLIASKPEVKHNRIFKNRSNLLIFSDIFLLLYICYPEGSLTDLSMREVWIIPFLYKKLIMYYLIDYYFFIYLVFLLLFSMIFRDKNHQLNIDQMWKNLKDEFDYKLVNNNKLFIKALDFYQKNTGKKKIINNLFKRLNSSWKSVMISFSKSTEKLIRNRKNKNKLKHHIYLGKLNSFLLVNSKLRNFYLEKNLYYNNKFFFYWKNFLFFDRDTKFYQKYDKDNKFLYFYLSLIFRKNRYSALIFFYFDTLNKMYFYNNDLPYYLNKTYDSLKIYFQKLDNLLFSGKGNHWLLHKDLSLILYKDESSNQSDMYSLNFNIIIPYFEKLFFWFIIIIYLYFTKFHWRLTPHVDFLGRINRMMYLHSLMTNDNFMYFYNIIVYWFNGYFMFDIKHFSYEYNDHVTEWTKTRRYFKHIRRSASFLINNDPLFFHKKNYAYHLLWLNKVYDINYVSFTIYLFHFLRKFIILTLLFIFYIKFVVGKKIYLLLSLNKNLALISYLLFFYNKNLINIQSYLNFYYKKILSN